MRVTREQAERNRERIVDTASTLFREHGFDGIGVADLMKAAGLTHGGFYGHFESKDDLAAQSCAHAFAGSIERWRHVAARTPQADALRALVERYLDARHRDAPAKGCVLAALAAEAPRQGAGVRRVFADGVRALLGVLEKAVPGRIRATRRRRALATLSGMVGAIVLARAVDDAALADEILEATRESLLPATRSPAA
ncbi:TetR/AcrR family transcriptional regulator [Dokdonella sp. MW10]|uniref:TetR/AcrR family transcriptional regulator n=1 Tax=Dokdonella sp. MW10 TaxID=2992926 RepID=UPI003F7F1D33